ncbi:MAG TPA: hypothetical protein VER98_14860 [Terriglobia bacterium]|nr:hypothetical protein [Terriglobia bacterium]
MSISTRASRIVVSALLAAFVCCGEVQPAVTVLWLDFDMKNIPEPEERSADFYNYFFKGQLIEHTKREFDIPRLIRHAVGKPRQAPNVNALDEVPDSSWYTNRHHLHTMTIEQLVRGPNQAVPDFGGATITKAKITGVTPGLMLKDKNGHSYLIKFDQVSYPNLQSGAEVICTKILFASGYNVPENYIAYINPADLEIDGKVEVTDPSGEKRAFTKDDLKEMLKRVANMPDGRYRVMASKILSGKPKGPFPQAGLRADDPNDLIPHEHRRELRGLRVFSSWINHWDMKEDQSLDMYVEEGGRTFLRHYLLDFGSDLGAGQFPTEYSRGREHGFDPKSLGKEIITFGAYVSADEKHGITISPEVGMFTAGDFDPEGWKPTYPTVMFDNMTDQDAFWAARIILSFTENELRGIVETAEYADPKDTEYVLETLMERRRIIAKHWLARVDGLSAFSVRPAKEGVALMFRDLMIDNKLARAEGTTYTYEIKGRHYKSGMKTIHQTEIVLDRAVLGAAMERDGGQTPIQLTIWTNREGTTAQPVRIYLERDSTGGAEIVRISRG